MNKVNKNIKSQFLKSIYLVLILLIISNLSKAQITVNGSQTANALAQMLTGPGVIVTNPVLSCPQNAEGKFFVTTSNLGLDSGIILTSGQAQTIGTNIGCNFTSGVYTTVNISGSDVDLALLTAPQTANDKCVLEFDFVPSGDTVKFEYVFGSSEYQTFTCSIADVFGFFISGPGITGPFSNNSKNIALVPGTNCPVGVNTINGSTQNPCGNVVAPCAPPNNALFNNNTGATVSYNGFTDVLQAIAVVVPCSTYHLKLGIADASDQILDSGVFLKAGSLSSNAVTFTSLSPLTAPNPYIVEGCAPGFVKVRRAVVTPIPYPVSYTLSGAATYGTDYTISHFPDPSGVPGTITIPANDSVAYIIINPIQDGITELTEDVIITQLAPCSSQAVGSASIDISDSIKVNIITPDTAICIGQSVNILVNGSDSLVYFWTPNSNINNVNFKEPTVSPVVTTTYTLGVYQAFSGCDTLYKSITITVKPPPLIFIGNDTTICKDQVMNFNALVIPAQAYNYTWSGATQFLSATNIPNPVGTFNTVGSYQLILNVNPVSVTACGGADTVNIEVLPNDFTINTPNTAICKGQSLNITTTGPSQFTYIWSPSQYLNNPNSPNPISTPDTSITYTCTATFLGCIPMVHSVSIDVQPNPIVNVGPDRIICNWDTVRLNGIVSPLWYQNYTYTWTAFNFSSNTSLSSNSILDPVFSGNNTIGLTLTINTPVGCKDSDKLIITVNPTEFANITPTEKTICPHESVQYSMTGVGAGYTYLWTPPYSLNFDNINNPISSPAAPVDYTVYTTSTTGCIDTDIVRINVASGGIIDAGPDQTIYPGEKAFINATGNCSQFEWFPPYQLSNINISNPIATPTATTKYTVKGATEYGCIVTDSININVAPEAIITIPNAFTPGNGTSANDVLKILTKGTNITLNYYRIFNRWGEMIFETKDINKGWDGTHKGAFQPIGTYVYSISAVTSFGKKFEKTGNVSLIR
jgi:gliding motility-associated-like protein